MKPSKNTNYACWFWIGAMLSADSAMWLPATFILLALVAICWEGK